MYQLQKCSCSPSLKQRSLTLFTTEDESSSKTAVSLDTSLVAITSFGHCHLEYFIQDVDGDVFDRVSDYVGVSAHPGKILSQDFSETFTVFVTILFADQSWIKLQQMYGKLFNFQTLYLCYYTTEFDKTHVF